MKMVIERREISSPWLRFTAPIASICIALFVAGFLLLASDVNPLIAYKAIITEALGSTCWVSETRVKPGPPA